MTTRRGRAIAVGMLGSIATATVAVSDASVTGGVANPANTFTAAASFCSAPGTSPAIVASRDSWIDEFDPNTAHGGDALLEVRSRQNGRNRRALVAFALPALPAGCTVTDASLRVTDSAPTQGRTVSARRITAAWTEGSVNWMTRPATATGTGAAAVASAQITATNPVVWAVGPQVQAMYQPGAAHGFMLADSVESQNPASTQRFASREGAAATRPTLVVTFG